jgi:hypothetical protein
MLQFVCFVVAGHGLLFCLQWSQAFTGVTHETWSLPGFEWRREYLIYRTIMTCMRCVLCARDANKWLKSSTRIRRLEWSNHGVNSPSRGRRIDVHDSERKMVASKYLPLIGPASDRWFLTGIVSDIASPRRHRLTRGWSSATFSC